MVSDRSYAQQKVNEVKNSALYNAEGQMLLFSSDMEIDIMQHPVLLSNSNCNLDFFFKMYQLILNSSTNFISTNVVF